MEAERIRGRLESQARQISSIEDRLSRGENETQDLEKRFEQQQFELAQHTERLQEVERSQSSASRALALKSEERDSAQGQLRERERGMEIARQQVLKLLGEASTLKNQLAQIDQYLVGIDRDVERIQRDEASASSDRERLEAESRTVAEASCPSTGAAESVEQRRVIEEELSTRKARAAEARRKLEELRAETSRLRARRDSLEEVLSHRSYTTESVKRLFKAVEKGKRRTSSPIGVAGRLRRGRSGVRKGRRRVPTRRTGVCRREGLGAGRARHWLSCARRWMAAPRSSFTRKLLKTVLQSNAPRPEAGDRESRTAERVLRLTNGLSDGAGRSAAALVAMLTSPKIELRRSVWRCSIPTLYFLLPDGVCYHGHTVSGGKKTGSGPLGLKREAARSFGASTARGKKSSTN